MATTRDRFHCTSTSLFRPVVCFSSCSHHSIVSYSQFSLYIHEYTETLRGRGDEGREGEERESNDCNDLTVLFISAMHLLTKIITFSAEKLIKLLTQLGSTLIGWLFIVYTCTPFKSATLHYCYSTLAGAGGVLSRVIFVHPEGDRSDSRQTMQCYSTPLRGYMQCYSTPLRGYMQCSRLYENTTISQWKHDTYANDPFFEPS